MKMAPRTVAWILSLVAPLIALTAWHYADVAWGIGEWLGPNSLLLVLVVLTSAVTDLAFSRIPNWITYPGILWGVLANTAGTLLTPVTPTAEIVSGRVVSADLRGPIGFGASLAGLGVCFLVMLMVYAFSRRGPGDVKLGAAVGAMLGIQRGLMVIVAAHILAAVAVVGWMIWVRGPLRLGKALFRLIGTIFVPLWVLPPDEHDRQLLHTPVPLGPFFAIGSVLVLLGEPFL